MCEQLDIFTTPPSTKTKGASVIPLGAFAGRLGGLLLGEEGPGASIQSTIGSGFVVTSESVPGAESAYNGNSGSSGMASPGNSSSQRGTRTGAAVRRAKLTITREGQLGLVGNIPALLVDFNIEHNPDSAGTLVKTRAGAVLDDNNLEDEPPAGSRIPEILEWIGPNEVKRPGSRELLIKPSEQGSWRVAVSIPGNFMVGLELTIAEVTV